MVKKAITIVMLAATLVGLTGYFSPATMYAASQPKTTVKV